MLRELTGLTQQCAGRCGILAPGFVGYFVARLALRAGPNRPLGSQLDVVGAVRACQPRSMPKRSELGVAGEVPVGVVVVGEVVIVVVGEVLVLLLAPGVIVAFVEVAGFDGEGRDADAGEREVVGAVVAAGGGFGVRDDGEVEALRRGLDCWKECRPLRSVDIHLEGGADGEEHVVVDIEGDLAGGDGWVLAEVFGPRRPVLRL